MKTVIVPIDFSRTSLNTANYAVKMLSEHSDVNVILYHSYEKAAEAAEASDLINELKNKLSAHTLDISTHLEESDDFAESLSRFARHHGANLIVMGLTGKTKLEQMFLTSKTLKVVEKNPCPIMIVPPSASFTQIKNIALTSDYKEVDVTIPVVPIKAVLDMFKANLHVVNVNSEHYVALSEDFLQQRNQIHEMFREYNPEFYFITTYDFHEIINQFVSDKKIDMIITIPRSHSFIENLFKPSNTKKLVFESTVPVLAAHE
jgi:nucleotide-binding universal stress UspA family protein